MKSAVSVWPDDLAVYRYLVGGTAVGSAGEPDQNPDDALCRFDGSLEELRDLLRSRSEPLGGRVAVVGEPASAVTKRRRRRGARHVDPVTLLDPDFAARFSAEVPALPARTPTPDVPGDAWFEENADTLWKIFMSGSFGSRPAVRQIAVLRAFDAHRHGRGGADRWLFWRLLNLEMWLRENVDIDSLDTERPPVPLVEKPGAEYETEADGRHQQAPSKSDYQPNAYKRLLLGNGHWARFPLRVDLVAEGDDIAALVARRAAEFFAGLPSAEPEAAALAAGRPWYVFVGEKIVAVAQGRFVLVEDIRPGRAARLLVRTVRATPFGIGVSQPETMQVAIEEAGLPRILLAAAAGAVGKVLRRRGWFYRVAGRGVASIDGPADYCAYPANVSAKLAPKDPAGVARAISGAVRTRLAADLVAGFGGTVLIDSNDLGQDILGHDTGEDPGGLAGAYADNPTGQGRQQTPISMVFGQSEPLRPPV